MTTTALDDLSFHAVFDHALDGVFVGAPDGRIFFANPAACTLFGATEEGLRQAGRQGISNPDDPVWRAVLAERRDNGAVRGRVPMSRLDGTPLMVELTSALFTGLDGTERSCVIVRDVTQQVRVERRLMAYDEITEALLAGTETAKVLTQVARHACIVFDATFASITTPSESPAGVVVSAAYGPGSSAVVGQSYPPGSLSEEVMASGEAILLDDTTAAARHQEGRDLQLGPGMIAPIVSEGTAIGVLFVGSGHGRHPYGSDDLASVAQYAARAGVVLALGQARTHAERLQRLTNEQLQRALDTRLVIEQAKGFIACLRDIDTTEAFDRLRSYSRSHSTNIHHVARRVLDHTLIL
jgi:PAS domain S-box-containing protein